ncbi:MAG: hypothetical protein OEN02_16240 [Gammaproteobacteria bacterium]|nr:hypothetical protein [Gammaproteobacteria bacterium]
MKLFVSRRLLPLILVLALSGCGFRLAGTSSLPQQLSSIYLITSEFSERQRDALRERLGRAGARVTAQPAEGAVQLSVTLKVVPDRRLVSSASTGKSVDRLVRALSFVLKDADGNLLAPAKTLTQQRDFAIDDDNLLASTQQRGDVIEDLEKALYEQLIRQLERI